MGVYSLTKRFLVADFRRMKLKSAGLAALRQNLKSGARTIRFPADRLRQLSEHRIQRFEQHGHRLVGLVAHVRDAEGQAFQFAVTTVDHETVLGFQRFVQRGQVNFERVGEAVEGASPNHSLPSGTV